MAQPACLTCSKLGDCNIVDEEKLYQGYYCGDWKEDNQAKTVARDQIMKRFGLAGAAALINRKPSAHQEE